MAGKANTTVRGRRLRAELRRLREERGLSIEDVVALSDGAWVSSTLSRWELGERIPRQGDLRMLLGIYEVEPERIEVLVRLAKEARKRGWWHKHGDAVPDWFQGFVGLESEASGICSYDAEFVPGLLQTPDYARAVHRAALTSLSPEQIENRVEVRIERQQLMKRTEAPQLWFILNEAVLRRRVGGATVMKEQLQRMLELIDPPHVTVQILPYELGAHPGMEGTFTILTFPEDLDTDLVYLELPTRNLYIEDANEVSRYSLIFNHLRATALGTEPTLAMIRAIIDEL